MPTADFLAELRWRGLLYQYTEGADLALAAGRDGIRGYCGFDPTAASLHVGSLVPVMGLVHLQRAGHTPIPLVGGGTGLVGDPSGKATERPLLDADLVEANAAGVRAQLERFLDFSGPNAARMRNNLEWLKPLSAIEFLRDVGKHFSINAMLAKESVRARLEGGISFTEFAYMLMQAYDFLELHRREGATLQIGGSDQWGNITMGVELIRRSLGAEAHGVTLPLLTSADGSKFGKSEGQNVWLDPARTSPYRMYQFWMNVDDRDAGRFLRMFTLLERGAIEALEQASAEQPEARASQAALAFDVTARVHGDGDAAAARDASRLLFDRNANPRAFSDDALRVLRAEIPFRRVAPAADGAASGDRGLHLSVLDALVETALARSKADGRRLVQQGAVSVNGRRLGGEEYRVPLSEAIAGRCFLIRKGSREMALVEVLSEPAG
jgi:tyrosyl-tRNA synthetase